MKHIRYIGIILLLALVTACHKDPPKTYDDTDMTITYYNKDFNFTASYNTFAVPDSTVLTTNYLTESEIENFYKEGGTSDQAVEAITQSFLSLGYTLVDSLSQADFITVPTVMMMKQDETAWYGTGWWWGYGGYGWGWGWGYKGSNYYYGWYPYYPWYPTGVPVTVSTYSGTIALEMLETESYFNYVDWMEEWYENNTDPPTENDNPPNLVINWQALIEGYSSDDGSYNQQRAQRGVQEAFAQSPYLQK